MKALRLLTVPSLLVAAVAPSLAAAEDTRPTWVVTGGARLSYDSNLYATEVERVGYPLKEIEALDGQIFAKIETAPLRDVTAWRDSTLSYQATYHFFDRNTSTENHSVHKLQTVLKGALGDWKAAADLAATYVDGSKQSPRYLTYSSYGMAIPRERRNQYQYALKGSLKRDFKAVSVRAVGAYTSYDMLTEHHNPVGTYVGYLNYIDRYDLNGGVDVGLREGGQTLWLGTRVGQQYQQNLPWATQTASNDYVRVLGGLEGKTGNVSYSLLAGPDFRSYADARASTDKTTTAVYAEGSASWAVSKTRSFGITGRQWRWVSSSGKATYDDMSVGLTAKQQLLKALTGRALVQWQRGDYVAPSNRLDNLYTLGAGFDYEVTKEFTLALDYSWQRDENGVAGPAGDGREYKRHLLTLELKARW